MSAARRQRLHKRATISGACGVNARRLGGEVLRRVRALPAPPDVIVLSAAREMRYELSQA